MSDEITNEKIDAMVAASKGWYDRVDPAYLSGKKDALEGKPLSPPDWIDSETALLAYQDAYTLHKKD